MHELAAARTEQLTRACKLMAPIRKHTYFGHGQCHPPIPLLARIANQKPGACDMKRLAGYLDMQGRRAFVASVVLDSLHAERRLQRQTGRFRRRSAIGGVSITRATSRTVPGAPALAGFKPHSQFRVCVT